MDSRGIPSPEEVAERDAWDRLSPEGKAEYNERVAQEHRDRNEREEAQRAGRIIEYCRQYVGRQYEVVTDITRSNGVETETVALKGDKVTITDAYPFNVQRTVEIRTPSGGTEWVSLAYLRSAP